MRRPRPVLEALFALCTFVCGFELFPALHQAAHAMLAPHVHELGSGRMTRARGDADGREPSVRRASDHEHHGTDSIAHRGVAFLHAPDATPTVPLAGMIARADRARARTRETHASARTPAARGPPSRAASFVSRLAA